jgi:hypothetical protein
MVRPYCSAGLPWFHGFAIERLRRVNRHGPQPPPGGHQPPSAAFLPLPVAHHPHPQPAARAAAASATARASNNQGSELGPFGEQQQGVGTAGRLIGISHQVPAALNAAGGGTPRSAALGDSAGLRSQPQGGGACRMDWCRCPPRLMAPIEPSRPAAARALALQLPCSESQAARSAGPLK